MIFSSVYIASHPGGPDAPPTSYSPAFHSPYILPSSVSRNSFICHSYENCRGVYQQFPIWDFPLVARRSTQALCFQIFAHSFAFFCAFLHSAKTQLVYFHALPHSSRKNRGCGGYLLEGTAAERRAEKQNGRRDLRRAARSIFVK